MRTSFSHNPDKPLYICLSNAALVHSVSCVYLHVVRPVLVAGLGAPLVCPHVGLLLKLVREALPGIQDVQPEHTPTHTHTITPCGFT